MDKGWGRNLPEVLRPGETLESWQERRKEIRALLEEKMYGHMPREEAMVVAENVEEKRWYAGKAIQGTATLKCRFGDKAFDIPVVYAFPEGGRNVPTFLLINFRHDVPDRYLPAEELIDNGFGFLRIMYEDIVNDHYNGDFSNNLGLAYYQGREPERDEWGKIGMWAFAMHRAVDYLMTRPEVDKKHIMTVGHSRLGKTSLWAGATDERVWATLINDSGAGGAAIMREKTGEHIRDFIRSGIWDWFCTGYKDYADCEDAMPFDAHFALALIAPRLVCVSSAEEDSWSDPVSECLTCRAASEVWELYGKKGLVMPEREAVPGEAFFEGSVGYQIRKGAHFFSRTDWLRYMEFAKLKIEEEKKA